ncbi:hypothetical protein [Pandoraea sp. NPDC087047]|uniref:hypothetical protein n=1 Tax=Pandoraea sp. NPDC087047 TaxID=3364390 RepID=UPI003827294A
MLQWVNNNLATIYSAISLVIVLAIYLSRKFQIDFMLMNFWYGLPVIGKIARLSKDSTRYSKDQTWTLSERTLCDAYKQFIHYTPEEEFEKRLTYLSKAHDLGRTPTPAWMMGLLFVLVLAEGLGFSYMLGTWMAGEGGSENARQMLMWAIVFVLCVIFVFVMHSAGHQLYKSNLIRNADIDWRGEGQEGKFVTKNIKLNDPQHIDDNEPEYKQLVNRIGGKRSYILVAAAVLIIVVVSFISTYMRVKHLDAERTAQTALMAPAAEASGTNPFEKLGQSLPAEIVEGQAKADAKAAADGHAAYKDEGMAAFLMLAFIFAVTQLVGITAGYRWGFAGRESKAAFKGTLGFSTYDDYQAFFTPMIQVAQSKLQALQQKMSERSSNEGLKLRHTFDDYLVAFEQKGRRGHTPTKQDLPATDDVANHTDIAVQPSLDDILAQIDKLTAASRRDEAIALIQSQPGDVRAEITRRLGERKAAREAADRAEREAQASQKAAAERAELDNLL